MTNAIVEQVDGSWRWRAIGQEAGGFASEQAAADDAYQAGMTQVASLAQIVAIGDRQEQIACTADELPHSFEVDGMCIWHPCYDPEMMPCDPILAYGEAFLMSSFVDAACIARTTLLAITIREFDLDCTTAIRNALAELGKVEAWAVQGDIIRATLSDAVFDLNALSGAIIDANGDYCECEFSEVE